MTIKNAASLAVVDKSGDVPKVLMGRRASKHVFMPNVYVFPGGRVDPSDRHAPYIKDYDAETLDLLMQQVPGRATALKARMLGLAAIRETFEEVGLMVGSKATGEKTYKDPTWKAFTDKGLLPDLSKLTYIARAITPPGQKRRFDTRFFMTDVSALPHDQPPSSSDELEDVRWVSLNAFDEIETHFITRRILMAVNEAQLAQDQGIETPPVPFYRAKPGTKDKAKMLTFLRAGKPPVKAENVSFEK